jgi:hypothetical protein
MGVNNVNTEAVMAFAADVQRDPEVAKKRKRVEGEWVLEEGQPQFRARVDYPAGAEVIEADGAPFMGGRGEKTRSSSVLPLWVGLVFRRHVRHTGGDGGGHAHEAHRRG